MSKYTDRTLCTNLLYLLQNKNLMTSPIYFLVLRFNLLQRLYIFHSSFDQDHWWLKQDMLRLLLFF